MPLKLHPPRKEGQSWRVRGSYLGVHVNRSARTHKRNVAGQVLKEIERQIESGKFSERREKTFADAALNYLNVVDPAKGDIVYVKRLMEHFRDTPLRDITQQEIDAASHALYPGGSAATKNRSVYTPVSAVLRKAGIRLGLDRPEGSGGNKATAWLWPEQAEALFEEAGKTNPEFAALLIVLCYTGLRLSEALGLTWNDVRLQDGFAYVPDTKNAEPRAVYLPPVAVAALANRNVAGGKPGERVFRFTKSGHLYSLLRVAAIRAGVDLPERSAFHIFRHTYATWMRRYGGLDTKGLVATGAWKDRKSADRYEHVVVSEEARRAVMLPTKMKKA
jgi:integrase